MHMATSSHFENGDIATIHDDDEKRCTRNYTEVPYLLFFLLPAVIIEVGHTNI